VQINNYLDAVYAVVLLYLGYTDIREGRIPNRVVLPAAGAALLEAVLAGTWRSDVSGGVIAATLFVLPILIYGTGKAGSGDVKLALFLGLWLGYPTIVGAILVAAVAVSALALVSWLRGTYNRKATVPMAPMLALGTFTMLALSSLTPFRTQPESFIPTSVATTADPGIGFIEMRHGQEISGDQVMLVESTAPSPIQVSKTALR
jgi:Flp pilus assembly protein protease CpaA